MWTVDVSNDIIPNTKTWRLASVVTYISTLYKRKQILLFIQHPHMHRIFLFLFWSLFSHDDVFVNIYWFTFWNLVNLHFARYWMRFVADEWSALLQGISIDKKMRCIWKRFGFSTYMDLSLLMSCIYIVCSARCKHKHRTHTPFVVPFKMAECILFIRMTRKTYHAMHFVMIVPISFCYGF